MKLAFLLILAFLLHGCCAGPYFFARMATCELRPWNTCVTDAASLECWCEEHGR